jgi:hypothetical protein
VPRRLSLAVLLSASAAFALACGGAPAQGSVNAQALATAASQAWSGTITITQHASNAFAKDNHGGETSNGTQDVTNTVVITMTKGIASSKIDYALREITDQLDHYDGYDVIGKYVENTVAAGTNTKDASIKVSLNDDGTYQIEYNSGGIDGKWDQVVTSQTRCKIQNSECQNTSSTTSDSAQKTNQGFVAGSVEGSINTSQPNLLTGTKTEPFDNFADAKPGTTTITWKLTR